jgi:hypothetical protein
VGILNNINSNYLEGNVLEKGNLKSVEMSVIRTTRTQIGAKKILKSVLGDSNKVKISIRALLKC